MGDDGTGEPLPLLLQPPGVSTATVPGRTGSRKAAQTTAVQYNSNTGSDPQLSPSKLLPPGSIAARYKVKRTMEMSPQQTDLAESKQPSQNDFREHAPKEVLCRGPSPAKGPAEEVARQREPLQVAETSSIPAYSALPSQRQGTQSAQQFALYDAVQAGIRRVDDLNSAERSLYARELALKHRR